jgi:hypothetical protein
MRQGRSTTILLLPLFATACGGSAHRAPALCDVAGAYAQIAIAHAKGRPVVFTDEDEPFTSTITGGEWWRADEPTSAIVPPLALLKQLQASANRNAVRRCASVRKVLDGYRIGYGSKARDAATTSVHDGLFSATIMTISLPVVSGGGKHAVLASSSVAGPEAASGLLHMLDAKLTANGR